MNPKFSLCAHIGLRKMTGKYFHRGLYEYYPQRPVRFVDFLANPSDQTYFFKESSFYVYYFLLVISLFVKVNIFPQVLQMWYLTSCILWYFNFASLYFKKKLVVFRWANSDLDGAVLKIFGVKFKLLYIGSNYHSCSGRIC